MKANSIGVAIQGFEDIKVARRYFEDYSHDEENYAVLIKLCGGSVDLVKDWETCFGK